MIYLFLYFHGPRKPFIELLVRVLWMRLLPPLLSTRGVPNEISLVVIQASNTIAESRVRIDSQGLFLSLN